MPINTFLYSSSLFVPQHVFLNERGEVVEVFRGVDNQLFRGGNVPADQGERGAEKTLPERKRITLKYLARL